MEPRNILYAAEKNPFEVYRQIYRTSIHYYDALDAVDGCRVVVSAVSSKLLSIGALLASYELKQKGYRIGISNVESQGYKMESPPEYTAYQEELFSCGSPESVMNNSIGFEITPPAPACIGTGLIVLDIVVNGDSKVAPRLWAGGSCGNVMIQDLSRLGWKSFPVGRLGHDAASDKIVADLTKFNVTLDFVQFDEKVDIPIIIEQIERGTDGTVSHRFFRICPSCGKWLPSYRAIPSEDGSIS